MFASPLDPDYTAGELLDHLMSWTASGVLYPDAHVAPYHVMNYPPLFLVLVRGLTWLGLRPLPAGRGLGTVGVLCSLLVVYRWLRAENIQREIAAGVTALAATSFALLYSAGQFHLESLAVAATVAGFFLARRRDPRSELLAGALLALGCLIKQPQVGLSLVALCWVWRDRGWRAWRVLVSYAAAGIIGCAAITAAFGMEAWRHMLTYTVGTFSLTQLALQMASHALPWTIFAVFAFGEARRTPEHRRDIRYWYLVATTIWILASARVGASYSYFLDWQLAVLLWIGPVVQRWLAERDPEAMSAGARLAVLLFGAQVIGGDVVIARILVYERLTTRETAAAMPALCPHVPPAPTLTVSESPGLVRACGGRPALDPFIIANLTARGLWNEDAFVSDLAAGRYQSVLLPFDPALELSGTHGERWTEGVVAAIRAGYPGGHILADGWWVAERFGLPGTTTAFATPAFAHSGLTPP